MNGRELIKAILDHGMENKEIVVCGTLYDGSVDAESSYEIAEIGMFVNEDEEERFAALVISAEIVS